MRVVHLCTNDFGGAAVAAINLHESLIAQGVESDLLTLGRTRNDVIRHHAVDPFSLGSTRLLNQARYKARRALERAGLVEDRSIGADNRNLQSRPPGREIFSLPYSFFDADLHPLVQRSDIVHLHWVSRGMIGCDRFFARCKKPVAWTLHDMNPFTGGCHHADECDGFTSDCSNCPQLADRAKARAYWNVKQQGISRHPKDLLALVAPSEWLAERARRSTILAGRDCQVIPNGFDTARFKPVRRSDARAALGLPAEGRIILFSAFDAANPRKGLSLLLRALEGRDDMILVSMGHRIPALAGRSNAISTGHLGDPARIALHYAAADLFVLPSLAENLPNTISESLLCGTPVCAFHVGGIPEQIDGTNGALVAPGDVIALGATIDACLNRAWDREAIAVNAARCYDRDLVASAYRRQYSELLA